MKALIGTAKEYGYDAKLIRSVDEVNDIQKRVLAEKVKAYFEPQGGVEGRTLALWGIAFKANTDDIREASATEVIKDLTSLGMKVKAFDPVANERAREEIGHIEGLEILDSQYDVLEGADALAVVTDWNQFRDPDFEKIKDLLKAPIVLTDGTCMSRNVWEKPVLPISVSDVFRSSKGGQKISIKKPVSDVETGFFTGKILLSTLTFGAGAELEFLQNDSFILRIVFKVRLFFLVKHFCKLLSFFPEIQQLFVGQIFYLFFERTLGIEGGVLTHVTRSVLFLKFLSKSTL